ncbi:DUF4159 domain-containing protein [Pseudohoeflea suaedae]|uniref:DUF4159 domain-containing protein n=1 Tax=Pseudohoeflea suaedae TaxID=877384 RepID=A0A4R5PHJ7_9HYPH|nr:DUF4159 domain-containing protein [Pseudohoeflea suaedae]TDH34394.1 DUF4159 domain-containing protein [Pseudohoeflea suaedae]
MMGGLPLAFGAPAILFGLVALPVIWWLLRLTPPRPQAEPFAPLAILARVLKPEETPSHSPWWLTALRLLVAALIILALSEPILNPRDKTLSASGPLVLMIDNGWASAPDWDDRVAAAEDLISEARDADVPVSIAFTSDRRNDATPMSASNALEQLLAAAPRPARPERGASVTAVQAALAGTPPGTIAYITDGMASDDGTEALGRLFALGAADVQIIGSATGAPVALTDTSNGSDALQIAATRLATEGSISIPVTARDSRGRDIARGEIAFEGGSNAGTGEITAPFEIRNDIARIDVDAGLTAAGVRLVDDSFRRRRVALISGEAADLAQPLLSPLYYIDKALSPYADLIHAQSADLAKSIPALIERQPAIIVMADIGSLPEQEAVELEQWIENGGTLVRFAGPRLAAADNDTLTPVTLRRGERELGGALSWDAPQPLADYPEGSPFAGLPVPRDVTVNRQVLAEPSADLAARTWASLADGTPLVTAADRGDGRIVLFHVTAEAGWSNLPISGHFVDMLRRVVQLSNNVGRAGGSSNAVLPPYQLLSAAGALLPASGDAKPLDLSAGRTPRAGPDNPPGLYGTEDGYVALNLFQSDERIEPLDIPDAGAPVSRASLGRGDALDLKPWLFGAALLGLLIDTLIVLVMGGALRRLSRRRVTAATVIVFAAGFALLVAAPGAIAQDSQPGDVDIVDKLDQTHMAYVITGDDEVDRISREGLNGLSSYLANRTALEPGEPVGVDIETDQLSFYPLIYWPMSEQAPMPSEAAISRIDAYMKNGGSVLFDTRDRIDDLGGATAGPTRRLQAILSGLDIPPLEPVPSDHVLTKAFYLLDVFPGRYADGPLWVEATAASQEEATAERPARAGDGVSSILITSNDFAAAWAEDENGNRLYPTVPNDPWQREYAYRAGVNIMMYMLTGNYKSDQVHIPALLERLGQ